MSAAVTRPQLRSIAMPGGFAPNPVLIKGEGRPIVFLHGAFGQEWEPFLDDIATRFTVHVPANPGSEELDDLRLLPGIWDLLLYHDDLFNALGLGRMDLIGHSFGGMVAAEFAAAFPHRVGKLVLIDALGLWRDDAPVQDHFLVPAKKQVELLYKDPSNPELQALLAPPTDPAESRAATIRRYASLGSTSHFIWPIAERGLKRRLRRISAETLILWGADDALTPSIYAEDFAAGIHESQMCIIKNAGHVPQFEQRETVVRNILSFLG
jgi:pimeloyl-ACP methyl ester carboxylesterase